MLRKTLIGELKLKRSARKEQNRKIRPNWALARKITLLGGEASTGSWGAQEAKRQSISRIR